MHKSFHPDLKSAGKRIRMARLELGLTQQQAADRTEISAQYWSCVETGREQGSVGTYMQIAAALELTLDDLFYAGAEAMRVRKALTCNGLLDDCTAFEKAIISDMILSLKTSLERNRGR